MPNTTIFIGSSSAAKSQAKKLIAELSSATLDFLPWWEAFTPGQTLLEELDGIRDKVQRALLLFSPESETTVKQQRKLVPNLNVLFEFGYFYGHFGKQKVPMSSTASSSCHPISTVTFGLLEASSSDAMPWSKWENARRQTLRNGSSDCESAEQGDEPEPPAVTFRGIRWQGIGRRPGYRQR